MWMSSVSHFIQQELNYEEMLPRLAIIIVITSVKRYEYLLVRFTCACTFESSFHRSIQSGLLQKISKV